VLADLTGTERAALVAATRSAVERVIAPAGLQPEDIASVTIEASQPAVAAAGPAAAVAVVLLAPRLGVGDPTVVAARDALNTRIASAEGLVISSSGTASPGLPAAFPAVTVTEQVVVGTTSAAVSAGPPACKPGFWRCMEPGSVECINEKYLCNGVPDCDDSSDEALKVCNSTNTAEQDPAASSGGPGLAIGVTVLCLLLLAAGALLWHQKYRGPTEPAIDAALERSETARNSVSMKDKPMRQAASRAVMNKAFNITLPPADPPGGGGAAAPMAGTLTFAKLDVDGDGTISRGEALAAGISAEAWRTMDTNGDGVVDKEEFRAWVVAGGAAAVQQNARAGAKGRHKRYENVETEAAVRRGRQYENQIFSDAEAAAARQRMETAFTRPGGHGAKPPLPSPAAGTAASTLDLEEYESFDAFGPDYSEVPPPQMQSAAGAGHDYAEPPLLNHQYDEVDFMPRGAPAAAGSSAAAAYRTLEPSDRGVYDDSHPMAGADGGPAASTYEALESNDGHNVYDGTGGIDL